MSTDQVVEGQELDIVKETFVLLANCLIVCLTVASGVMMTPGGGVGKN